MSTGQNIRKIREEKSIVFKMVGTFLTQKRFKDFFQKNIATL